MKIDVLNAWYREAYLGSDLYPGLFRELQAAAGGMEGIDAKAAKKALEETARARCCGRLVGWGGDLLHNATALR